MPFETTVQTHAPSTSCDLTSPSTKTFTPFSPFSPFSPSTKGLFTNLPNIHRPWRSKQPSAQDVIARIVAKDQALANAFTQPTGSQCNNAPGSANIVGGGRSPLRQVPERIDSHRALTSSRSVQTGGSNSAPTTATTVTTAVNVTTKPACASTAKATTTTTKTTASNGSVSSCARVGAAVTTTPPVACASASKSTSAGTYFNKSLPPTPRRSSPLNPNFKAANATNTDVVNVARIAKFANVPTNVSMISKSSDGFDFTLSMVMDTVKPLDIETCRRTLAAKRLSRTAHCKRSIPAPIFLPPLPLLAPQAVQGESPQQPALAQVVTQSKESRPAHTHNRSTSSARTQTQAQVGRTTMLLEEIRIADHEDSSMVITPIEVTPLDIPVDWDDLRDRWTSPVEKTAAIPMDMVNMADIANLTRMPKFALSVDLYDDDANTNEPALGESAKVDAADVFSAFQQDVTRLFAHSPSINVKGFRESVSIEIDLSSGSSASGDDASISEHDHPHSVEEGEEDFDGQSVLFSDLYRDFPEPPLLTAEVSRNVKRHARFVSLEDLDLDDLCTSPVARRLSHQIQLERGLERQQSMTASIEGSEELDIEVEDVASGADEMSDSQVRRDSCVLPHPPAPASSPRNLCTVSAPLNANPKPTTDSESQNPSRTSPKIRALGRLITDSASIDSHRAVPKQSGSGLSVNRHGARARELEPKKGESFLSMFSPMSPLQTGTIDIEFD